MQLLNQIQDIANQIQIKSSGFFVSYPGYQTLQLCPDVIAQLQKMPQKIQDEYQSSLLTKLIFAIYRNDSLVLEKSQVVETDYEIWLQNIASEVDWEFCEQLHNNNQGKGWWNAKFRLVRKESDGRFALEKKGITVHIEPERHLRSEDRVALAGDMVSVFTPSGKVINQFYGAFGDATTPFSDSLVFIYFNFNSEGAVAVMKSLTARMNAIKASFIFYVLHNPANYNRYDSGFLKFEKINFKSVLQVLQSVYAENKSHFQNQVPLFTKVLAPGLGLAEKPDYEFKFLDDFGMNRCEIVADALLEAHKNGDESPETRMEYILKHFQKFGIDIERTYLNPNAEDIYTPLDSANLAVA
jgi:hypothetical protein